MIFIFQKIIASLTRRRKLQPIYGATRTIYPDYTRSYNDDVNFTESFYENLRKTISWTQVIIGTIKDPARIDYLRVFRTINPVYEGRPFYIFNDNTISASVPYFPFNYNTILQEALAIRPDSRFPIANLSNLGKILRFEIDVTTHDGAPAAELGFVDESDIPPIDTWFYVSKKYLYCWIPILFINKMQDAIDVEILGSYEWLEKLAPALNHEIEEKIHNK